MNDTRDIRCYVLVRNDLPSLSSGKAAAHTHHAGVQMVAKYMDHAIVRDYIEQGIANGADHFNTTISLSASLSQIKTILKMAIEMGYVADCVEDPTYPFFVDTEVVPYLNSNEIEVTPVTNPGQTLVTRHELTCGYILGYADDDVFRALVGGLKLMP